MRTKSVILAGGLLLLSGGVLAGHQVWAKVNEVQTIVQMESALLAGLPGQRPGGRAAVHRFLERIGSYLELTSEQKAQIKAILAAERPVLQPLVLQAAASHQAITGATKHGEFNEAQLRALAAQQGQNVAALIVEKERVKTQIYQVLTPAQRTKLEELRQRVEDRIRGHFFARSGQ